MKRLSAIGILAGLLLNNFSSLPGIESEDPKVSGQARSTEFGVFASTSQTGKAASASFQSGPQNGTAFKTKGAPPRHVETSILTVINDITNSFAGLRIEPLGLELSRSVCPDGQQAFTIKRFTLNVANNAGILGSTTRTCETPTAATQITAATPPITVTQTMFQSLPLKQRRTECNCGQGKEQLPYGTVTVPIVFWQDSTPETVTTTMLG